jgi:multidrug efflux pump subunit AcrA (membrane-fusion protein)
VSVLVFVPYPLKMESKGELVPEVRVNVYSRTTGLVERFTVEPKDIVQPGRELVQMQDLQTGGQVAQLWIEAKNALREASVFESMNRDPSTPPEKRADYASSANQQRMVAQQKQLELEAKIKNIDFKRGADFQEGIYYVKAPQFTPEDLLKVSKAEWTVLNGNFRQELTGRNVQPNEPLLRLGAKNGPWEVELKIPQKHIGQVLEAFKREGKDTLDVDFLLRSDPTRKFKGILSLDKIAGQANPSQDDTGEAEPVVLAKVRIDGDDIPEDSRVPPELLLSGIEVHAKIRCGNKPMGYALFYGVWEFFYDKVVFFF